MNTILTKYRKPAVIVGVIGLVVVLVLGYKLFTGGMNDQSSAPQSMQEVAMGTPIDVVSDFVSQWLNARQSTTTNPYQEGLASSTILSPELRTRLIGSEAGLLDGLDPVLCQSATNTAIRITARLMNEQSNRAQVLVLAKGLPGQAIVTVQKQGEGWFISDIMCAAGEFAPEREFSFDMEGNLLKNVPQPLDSQYWHLVFTEDNIPGHTAPLFFDAESKCTAVDGSESVCDTGKFREAIKTSVQGEMTETGVKVKKLKLLE